MKTVVWPVRSSCWAGPMAAQDAKLREPEEHQGCTRPAADQHQRCAVEPVVVIVEAWPGGVRVETDPLRFVLVVEPQGQNTSHERWNGATVTDFLEEVLWAGVQRIDEPLIKLAG